MDMTNKQVNDIEEEVHKTETWYGFWLLISLLWIGFLGGVCCCGLSWLYNHFF